MVTKAEAIHEEDRSEPERWSSFMNKVLEFTPREEVILLKGLQLVLADKSSLLNSDDPAIVKVARNSIQEIRNLIDDVTSAEPTYLGGYAEK